MFEELSFRYPWRKYQSLMLTRLEAGADDDRRLHLVSPPGSGKTLIGLELIRRYSAPAVVFAPTATIRDQWRDKLEMFTADQATAQRLSSVDPAIAAPISIFTYQLISTPGQARDEGRRMAEVEWIAELIESGQVADDLAARERIDTMATNNPSSHRREIDRSYLRIKRRLLETPDVDVGAFLHPNARDLVARLAAAGVRTVVLDECHHLLDYWAIVLRYLLDQLSEPHVVGLTATLPSPEDGEQFENYTSLLGDVDFDVPTPAVVKEGDLAPYRDLVCFVEPSPREASYLANIQAAFEEAIADVAGSERFRSWLGDLLWFGQEGEGATPVDPVANVGRLIDDEPSLGLAGLRFWHANRLSLPAGVTLPDEGMRPLDLEDWSQLLERFGLQELKVSDDEDDHKLLARMRRVLLPFGLTLSESGLRQGRSPGDLVLSLSESKDDAVLRILRVELEAMADRLRAVIVTDYETMSARTRRVDGIVDRDAGSAFRVFRRVLDEPATASLVPILVTGTTLRIPASSGQDLIGRFEAWLAAERLQATCRLESTPKASFVDVVGDGPDWSPGTYARMATAVFDEGITRCLVGTRGIFGEGWDSQRLNTLIDLTSVTTATSVQQIRGRALRLDPAWPRKVAHAWDVICVASRWDRGDTDLARFARRHGRTWGIISPIGGLPLDGTTRPRDDDLGRVVRGVPHVDYDLAISLVSRGFKKLPYARVSDRMLAAAADRERTYDLWKVGAEYSDFDYRTSRIEPVDMSIRTVYTISETLKALVRCFRASIIAGLASAFAAAAWVATEASESGLAIPLAAIVFAVLAIVAFVRSLPEARRLIRTGLLSQPIDAILLDVGRAVLAGLRAAGVVSDTLRPDFIRVVEQPDASYEVLLDYASSEDASVFITAYGEVFAPVRDQRYLILRDDGRVPELHPLWLVLRGALRARGLQAPAYHPVPSVVATRERAEAYASAWSRYVGGGSLVYTRNDEGRHVLWAARAQRRPQVKDLAFETWR